MPQKRHQILVDEMVQAIRGGRWKTGARLPTVRDFSSKHEVAIATAAKVYASLEKLGLVVGETGRGTFVREWRKPCHLEMLNCSEKISVDLAFSYPYTPNTNKLLQESLLTVQETFGIESLFGITSAGGDWNHREAVCEKLNQRGIQASPEQILLLGGAQQALACSVLSLFQPGDVLIVDELTYPGILELAAIYQLDIQPLSWKIGLGPDMDQLKFLLKTRPVKGIYTMPNVHTPTGWVMPLQIREELASLAMNSGAWLLEDDSYGFLEEHPPTYLSTLLPNKTIHVSTFSKSVAGGIRFGYMLLPFNIVQHTERVLRALSWNQSRLFAALAAHWIRSGILSDLEQEKRKLAIQRQAVVKQFLSSYQIESNSSSFFVWVRLPDPVRPEPLRLALAEQGIAVACASTFCSGKKAPRAIRLNLSAVESQVLKKAIHTIKKTVEYLESR